MNSADITVRIGYSESRRRVSGTYCSIATADAALLPIRTDEVSTAGYCKTDVTLIHSSGDEYSLSLDIAGPESTIERMFRANFDWYLSERGETFLRQHRRNTDSFIERRQREARLWLERLAAPTLSAHPAMASRAP